MMYFVLLLLLSFLTGASAYQAKRDEDSSKADISLLQLLRSVGQTVYDPASNTVLRLVATNSTLQNGEDGCTVYRQTQIAQHGTWWSPWYKVGGCYYTDDIDEGADYEIGYGYSYHWLIEAGPISWKDISPMIGGQWRRLVYHSGQLTCHIPAHSSGSVWYQTQVMWGDAQFREIKQCGESLEYSAWSKYYHFDIPSKFDLNSGAVNLGCSVGERSECH